MPTSSKRRAVAATKRQALKQMNATLVGYASTVVSLVNGVPLFTLVDTGSQITSILLNCLRNSLPPVDVKEYVDLLTVSGACCHIILCCLYKLETVDDCSIL